MNEDIKEHYRSLYLKHGEAAETGQYSSRESQYLRFKYLLLTLSVGKFISFIIL